MLCLRRKPKAHLTGSLGLGLPDREPRGLSTGLWGSAYTQNPVLKSENRHKSMCWLHSAAVCPLAVC